MCHVLEVMSNACILALEVMSNTCILALEVMSNTCIRSYVKSLVLEVMSSLMY